jgi:hypothetical protein
MKARPEALFKIIKIMVGKWDFSKKISKTNDRLWIIGDSFAGNRHGMDSWQILLYHSFIGNTAYISSKGSRNIQTIIDVFLTNLYQIKENDVVILFLPTSTRPRLPLKIPENHIELTIGYKITEEERDSNYFTNPSYSDGPFFSDILEHPYNKDGVDYMILLNSSKSAINNWNKILYSLSKSFKFKLILVSWEDELDSNIVATKQILTNEIGFWHTQHNDYEETNGNSGNNWDFHFSKKMDYAFYKYIITKYPEYFNIV